MGSLPYLPVSTSSLRVGILGGGSESWDNSMRNYLFPLFPSSSPQFPMQVVPTSVP